MNILLTGARFPTTLALTRNLSNAKCKIYLCDSIHYYFSGRSKYVKKSFVVRSCKHDFSGFSEDIIYICKKYNINIIIPSTEESIYLARLSFRLSKKIILFCDIFEKLVELHNKYAFNKLVLNLGINAPNSYLIDCKKTAEKLIQENHNLIFKRVFSRSSSNVIVKPKSLHGLLNFELLDNNPWMAQEYIEGKKLYTYSICYKGKLSAHVTYIDSLNLGIEASIAITNIKHPRVTAWVKRFVEEINYTGQMAFDFIETASKELYPIECNPRATNGLLFLCNKGRLSQSFIKNDNAIYEPKDKYKIMFGLRVLLKWLEYKKKKSKKAIFIRSVYKSHTDFVFSITDPLPLIWCFLCHFEIIKISKKLNIPYKEAITEDIEFDGNSFSN